MKRSFVRAGFHICSIQICCILDEKDALDFETDRKQGLFEPKRPFKENFYPSKFCYSITMSMAFIISFLFYGKASSPCLFFSKVHSTTNSPRQVVPAISSSGLICIFHVQSTGRGQILID